MGQLDIDRVSEWEKTSTWSLMCEVMYHGKKNVKEDYYPNGKFIEDLDILQHYLQNISR